MDSENQIRMIFTVWADMDVAPLGQTSRLGDDLNGETVLRRTLGRLKQVSNVGGVVVFGPASQHDRLRAAVEDMGIDVVRIEFDLPASWRGVQGARKWANTCWRGGLLGACGFDEDLLPLVLQHVAERYEAEAVFSVPAHAVLVDPEILERQVEWYCENREGFKLNFTQAPPGLAGVIVETSLLADIAKTPQMLGGSVCYSPTLPKPDMIAKPCNTKVDPSIIQTPVRFVADNSRTFRLLEQVLAELGEDDLKAQQITDWVKRKGQPALSAWPEEIEIELVSGWPTPTSYRPTPDSPRGPIEVGRLVERVSEITAECDDLLVCLGGFGEPTRHENFDAVVRGLKDAGVWGICLNTTGLIDEAMIETIVDLPIDVVVVQMDVPDRQLYEHVMGEDRYEQVVNTIERMAAVRQERQSPLPIIVPEMIKTTDTMPLMEQFYDPWVGKLGSAIVRGYCDHAGQLEDLAVSSMAPPKRRPCRCLWSRMTILADGSITLCDQDYRGIKTIGNIQSDSLRDVWRGPDMTAVREAHLAEQYDIAPLCPACTFWHRP